MYTFTCPCGRKVTGLNLLAWQLICRAGKCQLCRLEETIRKASPLALMAITDFFNRTGYPS
jgi:hypothetical protein